MTSGKLYFTGLRYHLTAKDALEASFDESNSNFFQVQPTDGNATPVLTRFERTEFSFNYVRYLSRRAPVQPFLTAGFGAIESFSIATRWDAWDPSINFAFGTDFPINPRLAFRLEVRDHVGFLPAPLRGASHDIAPTAGVVFTPRTSSQTPTRFPQVEVFLEGGASVMTGGSGTLAALELLSNGQTTPDLGIEQTNSYSKSGRLFAGCEWRSAKIMLWNLAIPGPRTATPKQRKGKLH